MISWGAGTAVFMNLPEALARARDRGVLKRLRGTPLPARHYLAGSTVAVLGLTLLVAALVLSVGAVFPLKNLQNALTAAWDPAGPVVAWGNLAVLAAWFVAAGALAVRFFRWDPRRG
jgi:ABC-type multidrug transport system permease subunit